jgi:endoglycosylceramidase
LFRRIIGPFNTPILLAAAIGCQAFSTSVGSAATTVLPTSQNAGYGATAPLLPVPAPVPIRTVGRHFVDPSGRVLLLRGVNVSGGSKVPPFRAINALSDLDPLPRLGINVIRLLFLWEAYEPIPGGYDEMYLGDLVAVAHAAWDRGMYVIVDIHQDGFSRFSSHGAGDGFPCWAVSPRGKLSTPRKHDHRQVPWPVLMALDPTTHRSFADFYADANQVRSRYLQMIGRVACGFASVPGVIGYDLLNEPWGDEQRDLAPLYWDAAGVIRAYHPAALLFLEGQITTNCGLQTRLPRLALPNIVYAPHYYKPIPIALGRWFGVERNIDRAFAHMTEVAAAWDVPLFLGEYGMPAKLHHVGAYMTTVYDQIDACLASGAQWNYAPTWTEWAKDGWNGEDFNILDPWGAPRPNYRPRPYPRLTAGLPLRFTFHEAGSPHQESHLEFVWTHCPERGATEIFVPACQFPSGFALSVQPADALCQYDSARQVVVCSPPRPEIVTLQLAGPGSCR